MTDSVTCAAHQCQLRAAETPLSRQNENCSKVYHSSIKFQQSTHNAALHIQHSLARASFASYSNKRLRRHLFWRAETEGGNKEGTDGGSGDSPGPTDGGVTGKDTPAQRSEEEPGAGAGSSSTGEKKEGPFSGIKVVPIWAEKEAQSMQLPKEVVETLRNSVFGFDTFFVTGTEPYQRGVLFRGNLRGDSGKAYAKIRQRLQDKFGGEYELFLLVNPEDERPVAAVVPAKSLEPLPPAVPEWAAAAAFGLVAVFTTFLRYSGSIEFDGLSMEALTEGLPGVLVTGAVLAAHEAGHLYAAQAAGLQLGVPFFIPSWQLGSFGAITRIKGVVPGRAALGDVAAAGPLAGAAVALLAVLAGLALPPGAGEGVVVSASVFHDSVLVGAIAKLFLGGALREGASVEINPLVLAAWTALLINAINCIPAGELDGGRIAQALFGRKNGSRLSALSLGLLGLTALGSDVALYWVILVVFLQRGPIAPQADELTAPSQRQKIIGAAALVLGILVYCPLWLPFS